MAAFDDIRRQYRVRSYLLGGLLWIVSIPAALPAFALASLMVGLVITPMHKVGPGEWRYESMDVGQILSLTSAVFGFVLLVTPLLVLLFGERLITSLLRPHAPTANELKIQNAVNSVALAAGITDHRLLIVDSDATNVACLGSRHGRATIIATSKAADLPSSELEALIAMALACRAVGGLATGRLRLATCGPVFILALLFRSALRRPMAVTLLAAAVILVAGVFGFVVVGTSEGVTEFMWRTMFVLVVGGAMSLVLWAVMLVAVGVAGAVAADNARQSADAGAVGLTRYPGPTIALMERAQTIPTRPSRYLDGLGAIWVLPVDNQVVNGPGLNKRLALIRKMAGAS